MLKSATSNKNNENNNIIINNDNYQYCYSNKITIIRCGLEVFFGGFRQISAYFGHWVYFGLSSNRLTGGAVTETESSAEHIPVKNSQYII